MWWIAIVAGLALLAAACTSSGDEDEAASDDGGGTTTAAPATTAPATTGGDGTEASSTTAPADVELTASFRGVAADTITIGHTAIDFDTLNNDFGLDLAFQDFRPQMDAIVAWYNENGGVLGRQIEVIHEVYLPVGATTAEEACLKLTEDNEVFAILNGFSGPGAEDVNECITEVHETVLVGGLPRADQAAAAQGRWVTDEMSLDRRSPAFVTLLDEAGVLGELGPIMVVGSNPDEEPIVRTMAEALREAGVEVPVETWITTTGDETATRAEVEVFIEAANNEGVTTVALVGEGELRNIAFFQNAPEFTYLMGNGDRITDWQSIPPEGLSADTRILTNNNGPSPVGDPDVAECIDVVEAATGVEVIATEALPEGDPNYWSGTIGACRRMAVFTQIAEAAGAELTNDSWAAALDQVPDLTVPGFEFVSLSSAKTDARDSLVLVEYDLDTLTFEPISAPVDVG
ncbi:MAG: ABC transporter substrate-binding protein [Acidimicrobiia bacterium]|nr:ABC transporter substrate-binding protein [Acidimicrobiia bacterium]